MDHWESLNQIEGELESLKVEVGVKFAVELSHFLSGQFCSQPFNYFAVRSTAHSHKLSRITSGRWDGASLLVLRVSLHPAFTGHGWSVTERRSTTFGILCKAGLSDRGVTHVGALATFLEGFQTPPNSPGAPRDRPKRLRGRGNGARGPRRSNGRRGCA